MHVLIAGAGLGGLTLAQNLRKRGISYEIFERDEHKDARFQGWAIALHTITDELVASMPSDMPDLRQATDHMSPLKIPTQICLYPAESNWGKRVQRIEHDDQGVAVYFEDGTSAQGDILVGADGVKSVVRQQLLQKSHDEVLKIIPLAAIVGELKLSGEAFHRQLQLSHGSYSLIDSEKGYLTFCSLHDVAPDGKSARYYWIMSRSDPTIADPDHWLHKATQQEKLDHAREVMSNREPKFREIFDLTPVEGVKKETHIWRDLELSSLPAGRVILMGDAAHVMTPFRGEGGYNTFIDAMALAKILDRLDKKDKAHDIESIKTSVNEYNAEMLERGVKSVQLSREWVDGSKVNAKKPLLAPMKVIPFSEVVLEAAA
ncbi:hypothetical protein GGI42DRAFT_347320 [Trichoderma sp. SZMC 28013]